MFTYVRIYTPFIWYPLLKWVLLASFAQSLFYSQEMPGVQGRWAVLSMRWGLWPAMQDRPLGQSYQTKWPNPMPAFSLVTTESAGLEGYLRLFGRFNERVHQSDKKQTYFLTYLWCYLGMHNIFLFTQVYPKNNISTIKK